MFTDSDIIRANSSALANSAEVESEHEKIGIARIKLRHSHLQLTAVLAGFFEVDRMLAAWNTQAAVPVQCEFEVSFTDGNLIRGSYELWHRARGRPSLCNFIRTCLLPAHGHIPANYNRMNRTIADEYGNILDGAFLNHYEIERSSNELSRRRERGRK
jgi:hypothetical protein